MAKDAGNKMVGETLSNVAATDQSRKAQVDAMHRQAQEQYAQMDMNREVQRANAITQAAQGASNAMMTGAALLDDGSNLVGGSNKGVTRGTDEATTTPVGAQNAGIANPNLETQAYTAYEKKPFRADR